MYNEKCLFRAKRKGRQEDREYRSSYKNGEWVYGLLSKQYPEQFEKDFNDEMTDIYGVSGIEVDRDTLCQYIGLEDKNRDLIFEQDIVKIKGALHVVERAKCRFAFVPVVNAYCEISTKQLDELESEDFEIVGNSFDNKDLL